MSAKTTSSLLFPLLVIALVAVACGGSPPGASGDPPTSGGDYPRDVPGAAPDFSAQPRAEAPLSRTLRTSAFAQTFINWARNLRPNQGGRLWIAFVVTLLVAFDFGKVNSRRNRDLLLLLLPGIFLVELVPLGGELDDPAQAAMFQILFAGLFVSTVALFVLALRRAFARGASAWSPNMSTRTLVLLAALLFASNCFVTLSQNPDDAGIYTNIGASRILETGRFPYGDPTLRGGAAATYGPALYLAHMPFQAVLAPVTWMIEARGSSFLRRVVVGEPGYDGPPQLATKLTVLAFHVVGVLGLIIIGTRLAEPKVGWGLACLYMGSAYVSGLGGEDFTITGLGFVSHIAPMAITTIAFLALQRPMISGALLATGAAAIYYPAFYFPLWGGYLFWRGQDWRRFVIGFGGVCIGVLLLVVVLTDSPEGTSTLSVIYESTVAHQESSDAYGASTFSFWATQPRLAALWQRELVQGWDLFRPSVIFFLALLAASFFMARDRSVQQLALLTASIAIGVQLWKSHAGGSYVEWYYSFLLIGLFLLTAPRLWSSPRRNTRGRRSRRLTTSRVLKSSRGHCAWVLRGRGNERSMTTPADQAIEKVDAVLTRSSVLALGAFAIVTGLVVVWGRETIGRIVVDYFHELPPHPYFHPADGGRLYVIAPLVVCSSLALVCWPGIFAILAAGRVRRWTELFVRSFGASYILLFAGGSAAKVLLDRPLDAGGFLVTCGLIAAVAWSVLAYRVFRGDRIVSPLGSRRDVRRLGWTTGLSFGFMLATIPVLFWQDMHDDGFEALELGRSLSTHLLPRFPTPEGIFGIGGGMLPMAYPVSWFVQLFGPLEVSARLPLLLYLAVLFCLLIELIEWRTQKELGPMTEAALCLAVTSYAITMGFSAGYDPYFTDLAAPAAFETLTIVSTLSAVYFLWTGTTSWFLFFALLSFLCRPTGLLVLGFAALATMVTMPERRRAWLVRIAAAIGLCIVVTLVYNRFHLGPNVEDGNVGFPLRSFLGRFRFLRFGDVGRFVWAALPVGVLPFLSLLAVKRQDAYSRFVTVIVACYFAVFYFPAFVALHHFVPVMILPLIVFWRTWLGWESDVAPSGRLRSTALATVLIVAAVSLALSLPRHFGINRTVRSIGEKLDFRVGDYETAHREQVRHAQLLFTLIPPDWEVEDPSRELVTGYSSLIYYATRPKRSEARINYVVQPVGAAVDPTLSLIADDGAAALYVRDHDEWEADRMQSLRTDYRSPLYDPPRTTLFRHWGERRGSYTLDVKSLLAYFQGLSGSGEE